MFVQYTSVKTRCKHLQACFGVPHRTHVGEAHIGLLFPDWNYSQEYIMQWRWYRAPKIWKERRRREYSQQTALHWSVCLNLVLKACHQAMCQGFREERLFVKKKLKTKTLLWNTLKLQRLSLAKYSNIFYN